MDSAAPTEVSRDRGTGTRYAFGPFELNVESAELLREGRQVPLTPKAFDVLVFLLRQRQRVVTKDEIFKAVWRDTIVSDDSLSQAISSLRKALGDISTEPVFVATIPRRGYRFIAAVTPLDPIPLTLAVAPTLTPVLQPSAAEPVASASSASGSAGWPAASPVGSSSAPPARVSAWSARLAWVAVGAGALGIAATLLITAMTGRASSGRPYRLNLQPPLGLEMTSGAVLSPDGLQAVYAAEGRGSVRRLWLTPLAGGEPAAIPGTDGATQPFWSPDGRSVGFYAGGAIKTVQLPGGPVQTLAGAASVPAGISWSDGLIAFAGFRSSINAVKDSGGDAYPITVVDVKAGDRAHEWPAFFPDGSGRFLYTVVSYAEARAGTWGASLDGTVTPRRLIPEPHAIVAAPDHLLFVRDQVLMAQRFDLKNAALVESPRPIAGNAVLPTVRNGGAISAAAGLLAYGGGMTGGHLVWLDRTGQAAANTVATDLHNPSPLPKGEGMLTEGNGVWLLDLVRDTTTRLVADGSTPIASPDGTQFVFNAARTGGVNDLYLSALETRGDSLLLASDENKLPQDWTRDGRFLVYVSRNVRTGRDIWVLPMTGEHKPFAFSRERGNEIQAQVSPDGRLIAYASNEAGSYQVYVQAFPGGGAKRAVSPGGGAKPQWRADGRELFYLSPNRTLMAVPVGAGGEIGRPQPLFQAPIVADLNTYRSQFVPSADGRRFLFDATEPSAAREPVTVLVNWNDATR